METKDIARFSVTLSKQQAELLDAEAKALKVSRSEYVRALLIRGRDGLNFAFFQRQMQELNAKIDTIKDIKPAGPAPMQTQHPAQSAATNPAIEAAIMEILAFTRYRFLGVLSYDSMQKAGVVVDKTAVQEKAAKAVLTSIRNSEKGEV